jgi:hypothetical protein
MGDEPSKTPLEQLQHTLEAALDFARELTADRVLVRLLAAFRAMPAGDRPVVIDALEREVVARKLSFATEGVSGQKMVPNPNARFYMRAHENTFDRSMLERDEMMIATVRGLRVATLIPAIPDVYASWQSATLEAMREVGEATRTTVERLLHELLGFIALARELELAEQPPPPMTPGAAPARAKGS